MTTAIAIALYNGEKYILEQLDSLRNQTQVVDQVIMCDDGSTDRTREIVANYIKENKLEGRWSLICNEKNLGFAQNFYKALSLCDQELIFLADQDDLWDLDKIKKMSNVMETNDGINLLSCEYGVVDANGKAIHSFMERGKKTDGGLNAIEVLDILRAWSRPGMTMCVRRVFFEQIFPFVGKIAIPHDFALALCAADQNSFFSYNYIGAYHRRHDNNAAREEHRVFKLLDLERKLKDIKEWIVYMTEVVSSDIQVSEQAYLLLKEKKSYLEKRYKNLAERKMGGIMELAKKDNWGLYRKVAILCDMWIICFGKYDK